MPHPREPHYNAMRHAVGVYKKNLPYQRDARDAETLELLKESRDSKHSKSYVQIQQGKWQIFFAFVGIVVAIWIAKG